jgi:hypothetical protein
VLGQRLGPAKADGQLDQLERVQEAERLRLAPHDVEGEHRAGRQALLAVERVGRDVELVLGNCHGFSMQASSLKHTEQLRSNNVNADTERSRCPQHSMRVSRVKETSIYST